MDERTVAKLRLAASFAAIKSAALECGLADALAIDTTEALGKRATPRSLRAARHVAESTGATDLGAFLEHATRLLAPILTASQLRVMRRDLIAFLLDALPKEEAPQQDRPRDLEAWARERELDDVLASKLPYDLPSAHVGWHTVRHQHYDASIGAFLALPAPELAAHQAALFTWLEDLATRRREALEEERAAALATRPLPEDETLAELVRRLRRVRAAVRESVMPRRAADVVVVDANLTEENPRRFRYEAVDAGAPRWMSAGRKVFIPVSLEVDVRPICSACDRPCEHQLGAIDHLLGVIFGEVGTLSRTALIEAASTPTWQRWIQEFDAAIEGFDETPDEVRVWWSVAPSEDSVVPLIQHRGKRGTFLKPKRVSVDRLLEEHALEATDEAIALRVQLMKARRQRSKFVEATRLYAKVLMSLIGHPRVTFEGRESQHWRVVEVPVALKAESAETIDPADEDAASLTLRAVLLDKSYSAEEWTEQIDPHRVGGGPVVRYDEAKREVLITPIDGTLAEFLRRWIDFGTDIPAAARSALMTRLTKVAAHIPVRGSDVIQRVEVEPSLDVVFQITPLPRDVGVMVEVRIRPLEHGPLITPGAGVDELTTSTPNRQIVQTTRDRYAELEAANAAIQAVLTPELDGVTREDFTLHAQTLDAALELIHRAREREDIEAVWPVREWYRPSVVTASALSLQVNGRKDWFDVEGAAHVDGKRIELAVLLDAARHRERFVRLGDGEFVELEATLLRRLEALAPLTMVADDRIELSLAAAQAVDALGRDAESYDTPDAWASLLARIDAAAMLEPETPPELAGVLRPYQRDGHAWLTRLAAWDAGAVLADDMGLGKTVQTIACLLDRSEDGPALVVAPTSVGFNWARELARFAPRLNVIAYSGADRERHLKKLGANDVVITSYGVVQRDAELLAAVRFRTLVLDEAQAIKNAATKRSRAVRKLDAAWTVALTGTPVENHPSELWALFSAIFPGLLGSWERFKRDFFDESGRGEADGVAFASAALAHVVRPFILRRTKREVATDLPPRSDVTLDVVLSTRERALYDDARLAAIHAIEKEKQDERGNQMHVKVLAALTRLRQLACHPRLVDDDSTVASSKLDRVLTIVRELVEEGRRALVFSQFVKHLALVREALEDEGLDYAYLDGSTPAKERAARVDRFQAGDVPLFLISVKAGGTGLNLTAADTVLHLDPWWNPAVEDQATDRAHRIGQTHPVTVYRLVTRDTVEETILELHADKRDMVAGLLDGANTVGRLSTDDLAALIRRA